MSTTPVQRGLRRGVIIAAALGAAIVIGLGAQYLLLGRSDRATATIGGPFTMVDQDGRTVTDRDYAGKILVTFFGYTYCPDVCPTELAALAVTLDQLGPDAKQIVPIFVTIDPLRDTPDVMKGYVANYGEGLIGLTGSEAQVAAMAKAYKVYFASHKSGPDDKNYLVDHSAFVYVMGRDGKYLSHFRPNTSPEEMAAALRKLIRQS